MRTCTYTTTYHVIHREVSAHLAVCVEDWLLILVPHHWVLHNTVVPRRNYNHLLWTHYHLSERGQRARDASLTERQELNAYNHDLIQRDKDRTMTVERGPWLSLCEAIGQPTYGMYCQLGSGMR